jgi:BlaI family transcriptional regulator, penicillinase repressor
MQPLDHPARRFIPHRTGEAGPLGQLEIAVMAVVWSHVSPLSVGDVHSALPAEPGIAYNTVKTTMERLAGKGILSRSKEGKAYFYQAAVTREELERRIVANALDRLVEHFPQAVASFFVRPDPGLSEEQLALLAEAIDRKREAGDA